MLSLFNFNSCHPSNSISWRTIFFFTLVSITNVAFFYLTGRILFSDGITPLEIVIFLLFSLTFSWISISFWNAIVGFVLLLLNVNSASLQGLKTTNIVSTPLASRTALIMPVRNEDPEKTMTYLAATLHSLALTHSSSSFDAYLLSDTNERNILPLEKNLCEKLNYELEGNIQLYYRHREVNTGHKSGNIADFCQRWGKNYDFMVVLDSDSIMEGATIVELASLMEQNSKAGLIQTVPTPINQTTLFGRILQFSSALYSPLTSWGQSFWYANNANYWGHNAIIRVGAFTEACGLPHLPGELPFGGEILSHDFVEASLLKRAGWNLFLLPHLKGTYEMVPGDILSYVKRERRWAQGSLQHLQLVVAKNIHFMNRIHFLMGAMSYLSSVLWLCLLIASTGYILSLETDSTFFFLKPYLFHNDFISASWKPTISPLLITGCVLFLPKMLSLTVSVFQARNSIKKIPLLMLSTLLENIFAILLSPILMFYHTLFIFGFVSGATAKWEPSEEREVEITWKRAFESTGFISISCLMWASVILWFSPIFFLWMLPIFIGLTLSNPIICLTTKPSMLQLFESFKLFSDPRGNKSATMIETLTDSWKHQNHLQHNSKDSTKPPLENPTAMPTQKLT